MIHSFGDRRTAAVFAGKAPKGFPADLVRPARRKLVLLDLAGRLDELRQPPGNRLEALQGDRSGQHSIRVNDHWRICFVWSDSGTWDVEIVDYH